MNRSMMSRKCPFVLSELHAKFVLLSRYDCSLCRLSSGCSVVVLSSQFNRFSEFFSVLVVTGRPGCSSSLTFFRLSENHSDHSKSRARFIALPLYISFKTFMNIALEFFLFQKKFEVNAILDFWDNHDWGTTKQQYALLPRHKSKRNKRLVPRPTLA